MSTQKTLCSLFLFGRLFHSQLPPAPFCAKTGTVKAIMHTSKIGIRFFIIIVSLSLKFGQVFVRSVRREGGQQPAGPDDLSDDGVGHDDVRLPRAGGTDLRRIEDEVQTRSEERRVGKEWRWQEGRVGDEEGVDS